MSVWTPISSGSATWASSTINNTDVQDARLVQASADLVLLTTPTDSPTMTAINYALRLVEKTTIDGYTGAEIDASAEEYRQYMLGIYTALGVEIAYWNASLTAGTVPANTITALQDYITAITREKTFWYQNDPSWVGSGEKGKEWQTDYVNAYYNSVPNTSIRIQKTDTYTEEVAMLTQKIAAMDALSALGFELTYYTNTANYNTAWIAAPTYPSETYLTNEDGTIILNEDGTYIILE